jgi:hypothetical protein
MVCGTSCLISIVFLVAMAYFYTATSSSHIAKNYEATLTPEQRTHYKDIVSERTRLAYEGYGLGFIISVAYIWINRMVIRSGVGRLFKREKMSVVSMVCVVIAIASLTNYFYYVLSPKKKFMLNYLNNQEEISRWLVMYKEMQFNYHMGLLCGVVAAGIGAFAFRWNCSGNK